MSDIKKRVGRVPPAIVYIRMNTPFQEQTESNSAEVQRSACMKFCQENNLRVSKVFEQIKSGKLYRKDLFNIIENEMRAGSSIVVYSITRFTRKQKHVQNLIDILKRKKCRLISVMEKIDTSEEDKMVELYSLITELESKEISYRVKNSIEEKKERLEHVGGMPYGYKYSDGKGSPLIINEEEMNILDRMRKMRNEDKLSFLKIARALNVEGIPSPKRQIIGGWSEMSVKRIVERDDSKILTRGKRSWYMSQEQEESDEESDEETAENIPIEDIEVSNVKNQTLNLLYTKPLFFLRALVRKKPELGLTDEEILELNKEELILLLS
jgi:DNA invertase Pin-like site-specific DNA recombinase